MKKCNQKVKHTCGNIIFADCTSYEGTVNIDSEFDESDCLSIENTTQDTYDQLGNIWSEIDLSELGETCLEYITEEGKIIVKNVLLRFEEKICELQDRIIFLETEDLCSKDITNCGLDFSCLTLPCDSITTFGQLVQALINKSCE